MHCVLPPPPPTRRTLWVIWPAETAPGWTDLIVQLCKAALRTETTATKREVLCHSCTLPAENVNAAGEGWVGGGGGCCYSTVHTVGPCWFVLPGGAVVLEFQDSMQLGALRSWFQKVVKTLSLCGVWPSSPLYSGLFQQHYCNFDPSCVCVCVCARCVPAESPVLFSSCLETLSRGSNIMHIIIKQLAFWHLGFCNNTLI